MQTKAIWSQPTALPATSTHRSRKSKTPKRGSSYGGGSSPAARCRCCWWSGGCIREECISEPESSRSDWHVFVETARSAHFSKNNLTIVMGQGWSLHPDAPQGLNFASRVSKRVYEID